MSRRPVIGISTSQMPVDYAVLPQYPLNYVGEDYTKAVLSAGGVPILLGLFDPTEHPELAAAQLDLVDGLLLTGGMDVSPLAYGEQPHPKLGRTYPIRDRNEFALLAEARRRHLPVLAICRGIQIVNVACGGTLYQDLESQRDNVIQHEQHQERWQVAHEVEIDTHSRLHEVLGVESLPVTTFHHQAIKDLGDGLRVVAQAPDGVIEAVESTNDDWLVGVQWHPEMSRPVDAAAQRLFDGFVSVCSQRAS